MGQRPQGRTGLAPPGSINTKQEEMSWQAMGQQCRVSEPVGGLPHCARGSNPGAAFLIDAARDLCGQGQGFVFWSDVGSPYAVHYVAQADFELMAILLSQWQQRWHEGYALPHLTPSGPLFCWGFLIPGIEPRASCLPGQCSTPELPRRPTVRTLAALSHSDGPACAWLGSLSDGQAKEPRVSR